MKLIQSTKGQVIKVCECHYDKVKDYTWSASPQGRKNIKYRAVMGFEGKTILMHRFIMEPPDGMVVDHINGNPMDNRCSNLRICTQAQNSLNNHGAKHNSVSGHKGVYWHKAASKWCAEVVHEGKKHYLGVFKNKLDAVEAYNNKAKELHDLYYVKS